MHSPFPGLGTLINIAAIILGSLAGMAVGHRLRESTRRIVTDSLGLITLLVAARSAMSVADGAFTVAVPSGAPVLIALGALLIGGGIGSALRLEERLNGLGGSLHAWTQRRWGADASGTGRERFVDGWLAASLLFGIGPLMVPGSLSDGLGRGIDQRVLKSVLDGSASLAFASTFGIGVMFSAVTVLVLQGSLTLLGVVLGAFLPDAHIAALTATGGLILVGIALRLLRIREDFPVAAMLPALIVAPVLTELVVRIF